MSQLILYMAILVAIYVTMAVPLNLMMGYGGLLSMTPAAFFGVGAYAAAVAATRFGAGFLVSMAFAGAVAAVAAALIAVPLLRLHDDYFVIGTLAFQAVIAAIILNWESVTKGPLGLVGIPHPNVFGVDFVSYRSFLFVAVPFALASVACSWRIAHSPTAFLLRGIRDDEVAVTALGRDVRRLKVHTTVYSAIWLALGGGLYAYLITALDPTPFSVTTAIFIFAVVIVGGSGTVYGPVVGAVLLVPLPTILSFVDVPSDAAAEIRNIVYGVLLIVLMRFRPQGLFGERTTFTRRRATPPGQPAAVTAGAAPDSGPGTAGGGVG